MTPAPARAAAINTTPAGREALAPARRRMNLGRRNFPANLGLAALTCSSAAFVAGAYGAVALLVYFLRRFERGEEGARRGDKATTPTNKVVKTGDQLTT